MELITLIILILLCGVGIILAFRLITYVLRIVSVTILLVFLVATIGIYFNAQAYVLPQANSAYITLSPDGNFVVTQESPKPFAFDSVATAAFAREFIKPVRTLNSTTYKSLRDFANDDFFAKSDTVWLINAINKTSCSQDRVIKDSKLFATFCLSSQTQQPTQNQSLIERATTTTISGASTLDKVPLKANFWRWLINYVF